jgi:hypothetical protein
MTGFFHRAVLAAALSCAFGGAMAQGALRPEVGKPLAKAKALLAEHQFAQAMAQVRLAASARGLTPDENFVIEEMRGAIAESAHDYPMAIKTYSDIVNSGRVPPGQQVRLLLAETSMAYEMHNYPSAIGWAMRYFKAGGNDPSVRALQIQAYYLNKDYASAAKLQSAQIASEIASRHAPTELQLQLLVNCQQQLGDTAGATNSFAQLVTYYPKPDYWQNLVHLAQTHAGFSDRLTFEIDRFELAVGLLTKPTDLMEMVELALQAGLPGEAKAITDKAFATGVFGTGPEAARQQRLRALVEKTYASEKPLLAGRVADARGVHDGNPLVALGEEYASYSDYATGIPLILEGFRKDELRHPDDSKLDLGLIYLHAGQSAQAAQMLRSVGGHEGAADTARLWLLQAFARK